MSLPFLTSRFSILRDKTRTFSVQSDPPNKYRGTNVSSVCLRPIHLEVDRCGQSPSTFAQRRIVLELKITKQRKEKEKHAECTLRSALTVQ
jgi:hypothetical protein